MCIFLFFGPSILKYIVITFMHTINNTTSLFPQKEYGILLDLHTLYTHNTTLELQIFNY